MDLLHDDAIKSIGEYTGKLYGAAAYAHLSQTCKRIKQLLLPTSTESASKFGESNSHQPVFKHVIDARVAACLVDLYKGHHPPIRTPAAACQYYGVNTLQQLVVFEEWIAKTPYFHDDNRIMFPFASTEIEPDMNPRINGINRIMHKFPSGTVTVRLDSHCGTAAPSEISAWFSRARGLSVKDAICGDVYDTDNTGPGHRTGPRSVDPALVNVVAWGKQVASVIARLPLPEHHPFQHVAREGRGWAEVYFMVPGGSGEMILPPRHEYYRGVIEEDGDSDGSFVDDELTDDNSEV